MNNLKIGERKYKGKLLVLTAENKRNYFFEFKCPLTIPGIEQDNFTCLYSEFLDYDLVDQDDLKRCHEFVYGIFSSSKEKYERETVDLKPARKL